MYDTDTTTDTGVNTWLAHPGTTTCDVHGHRYEDHVTRPGVRVCRDCDDEYTLN